jgi:hypothetical protein
MAKPGNKNNDMNIYISQKKSEADQLAKPAE